MRKSILLLNDGFKYVVTNEVIYKDKQYLQLLKVDDDNDFVIVEKTDRNLVVITDPILRFTLIKEFADSILKQDKQTKKEQ